MPRIYLVRHAKPAAAWGDDADPGLDALGITQAAATAQQLAKAVAKAPLYSSPLRRCRETALPLCELWQSAATVLPALIGARTLALLDAAGPAVLQRTVKVPRREVRAMILSLALTLASRRRIDAIFDRAKL